MRPSAPGVAVGIACCKLGAAFAGSHNPNKSKLINMNRIKKRFGFISKIISGFSYAPMFPVGRTNCQFALLVFACASWLFHAYHFAVIVDDHFEAHHAEVGAHIFRDAGLHERVKLFFYVFELLFDDRF